MAGPGEQRSQGRWRVEEAVAVGAEHLAVFRQRAVRAPAEHRRRPLQGLAAGDAHVDAIAAQRRRAGTGQQQTAADILESLLGGQRRLAVQPAKPRSAAGGPLESKRVVQLAAEHLQAATDADEFAAVAQVPANRLFPALGAQPGEVGLHRLRSGQDDQLAGRRPVVGPDEAEIDLRVKAQRV
ncbi:MAG: hypothetical protein AW12_00504 [Candidatus Accumulibacter sp. BA-94]|nr:MAG: hypothetical protein AW12_00504 [Candidatus Accumulibacter sp. BA-94]